MATEVSVIQEEGIILINEGLRHVLQTADYPYFSIKYSLPIYDHRTDIDIHSAPGTNALSAINNAESEPMSATDSYTRDGVYGEMLFKIADDSEYIRVGDQLIAYTDATISGMTADTNLSELDNNANLVKEDGDYYLPIRTNTVSSSASSIVTATGVGQFNATSWTELAQSPNMLATLGTQDWSRDTLYQNVSYAASSTSGTNTGIYNLQFGGDIGDFKFNKLILFVQKMNADCTEDTSYDPVPFAVVAYNKNIECNSSGSIDTYVAQFRMSFNRSTSSQEITYFADDYWFSIPASSAVDGTSALEYKGSILVAPALSGVNESSPKAKIDAYDNTDSTPLIRIARNHSSITSGCFIDIDTSTSALHLYDSDLDKVQIGKTAQATSESAISIGVGTIASHTNAIAIGNNTSASGDSSIALGKETLSSGLASLSLGYESSATGAYAISIGRKTRATGYYSMAGGYYSSATAGIAIGSNCYNEGYNAIVFGTLSSGYGSDAFTCGINNKNEAPRTFMIGQNNISSIYGYNSVVAGSNSSATNNNTVIIGNYCLASGSNAQAFGSNNNSTGSNTFSTGYSNIASGSHSACFGESNKSIGLDSHALGFQCVSSGARSFASGYGSSAIGEGSVALGYGSLAYGDYSFTCGEETSATVKNCFAIGNKTLANNLNSFASGYHTSATGSYSVATGYESIASGTGAISMGGLTSATGSYSFATGNATKASNNNSFACGSLTEASGVYSFSTGYNTLASGSESFATGVRTSATGKGASSFGYETFSGADYSVVFGYHTSATGVGSISIGRNNLTSGTYSTSIGREINCNADNTVSIGYYNNIASSFEYCQQLGGHLSATNSLSTDITGFTQLGNYASSDINTLKDVYDNINTGMAYTASTGLNLTAIGAGISDNDRCDGLVIGGIGQSSLSEQGYTIMILPTSGSTIENERRIPDETDAVALSRMPNGTIYTYDDGIRTHLCVVS